MSRPGGYFLLGPTASGKTALALALASREDLELVCLDSMQVYRGYPIASAQPTAAERARVPHHLFEIRDLADGFDAGEYAREAAALARRLAGEGRRPLFVGGTALYYKALVVGLADMPRRDPALRAELAASWEADGGAAIRAELARVDPETAARLGPRDYRRHERAIEVFRLTGTPLSELHRRPVSAPVTNLGGLALRPPRAWVRGRVEARHRAMIDAGLVEEMRGLWRRFRDRDRPPPGLQAIGFRQLAEAFEGRAELAAGLAAMRAATMRLVRHQETWLRRLTGLEALDPAAHGSDELADAAVAALFSSRRG